MNELKNVTDYFDAVGRRDHTPHVVKVAMPPWVYQLAPNTQHHWLYFTQLAFKKLQDKFLQQVRAPIQSFWSCGSSHGLDAGLAWEILRPREIIITDIVPEAVKTAVGNARDICVGPDPPTITGHDGDLAEPLVSRNLRVDIAYANLPVIPLDKTQQEICDRDALAASFYPASRLQGVPDFATDNLLQLYYTYLTQTRECLNSEGTVVCAFGGRRLWQPIETLFHRCGYSADMVVFDIKPQEQADLCLPVYHRFETPNLQFSFFPYPDAKDVLNDIVSGRSWEKTLEEETDEGLRHLHSTAIQKLRPLAFNAGEAQRQFRRGNMVGHIVYVVAGQTHPGSTR